MTLKQTIRGCPAVVACVALGLLGVSAEGLHAAAADRLNFVVFISDDHGYADCSLNGAAEFRTPNLERVAEAGMTFTRAFAASPTCAPSRAALLTGLMPVRNGSLLNHQPPRGDVKTLPAYLQEQGYEVVAFGKVAHYQQGVNYGFDHVSHDRFHDDTCVDAAVEFLERRGADEPLCLFVGTNWPHVPWPLAGDEYDAEEFAPPPTHVDTQETRQWRAHYAAAVQRFDSDLGNIYDTAFKRLGSNTLFLHFSDHGPQWPFAKWNLYEAGTRVPFVAVWPGVIRPASQSDAMLSLVDVLPTLVEAAGGKPAPRLDGRSFADVLTEKRSEHRNRIFATHSGDGRMNAYPMRSVRTSRWKYIRNLRPGGKHTTHIDRGKAVDGNEYWKSWAKQATTDARAAAVVERYHHRPAEELYDLQNDPHEQCNLSADPRHAATLAGLRSELDNWMRDQGDHGLATECAITSEFHRSPSSADSSTGSPTPSGVEE